MAWPEQPPHHTASQEQTHSLVERRGRRSGRVLLVLLSTLLALVVLNLRHCTHRQQGELAQVTKPNSVIAIENAAATYNGGIVTLSFELILHPAPQGAVGLDYQINTLDAMTGNKVERLGTGRIEMAVGEEHKQVTVTLRGNKKEELAVLFSGITGATLGNETSLLITPTDITPKAQPVKKPKSIVRHRVSVSANHFLKQHTAMVESKPASLTASGSATVTTENAASATQAPDDLFQSAGPRFIKLDAEGKPLPDQTVVYAVTPWSCVLDNRSGLVWEVKNHDGGLHERDWTYTWFDADASTNGGKPGRAGKGNCGNTVRSGCDTQKFVAAVNATGFCGAKDWRLPTQDELQSLADLGHSKPAIDGNYFPNTLPSWYWTSSPVASDKAYAWLIGFYFGYDVWGRKDYTFHARLVRTAPATAIVAGTSDKTNK